MSTDNLQRFGQQLRGYLATVPRAMGIAVVEEAANNFRRQGYEDEVGAVVPWAPRKQGDTVKSRRKADKGKRVPNPRQRAILVKTGRLRRSIRIVATMATSVTVGSSEPYAEALQDGNDRGMPARPFITVGRSLREKLTKKIVARITGLIK